MFLSSNTIVKALSSPRTLFAVNNSLPLKEERVYSGPQFEKGRPSWWEAWQQELEATGHIASAIKKEKTKIDYS